MTSIVVQARYRNGVLQPQVKLDLPEDALVQVQVTPVPAVRTSGGSLFGVFPELAGLTSDDFAWAERLWEHGIEKQSRILDDLE